MRRAATAATHRATTMEAPTMHDEHDDEDVDEEGHALLGVMPHSASDATAFLSRAQRGHALVVALAASYAAIASAPATTRVGTTFAGLSLPVAVDGPLSWLNHVQTCGVSIGLPLIAAVWPAIDSTKQLALCGLQSPRVRSLASLLVFVVIFVGGRSLWLEHDPARCHYEDLLTAVRFLAYKAAAIIVVLLPLYLVVPIAFDAFAEMRARCPATSKRRKLRAILSLLPPAAFLGLIVRHTGFVQRHLEWPPSCPAPEDVGLSPSALARDTVELFLLGATLTALLGSLATTVSPGTPAEDAQHAGVVAILVSAPLWPLNRNVFLLADAAASLAAIGLLPGPSEYEPARTPDDPVVEAIRLGHFLIALAIATMHTLFAARTVVAALTPLRPLLVVGSSNPTSHVPGGVDAITWEKGVRVVGRVVLSSAAAYVVIYVITNYVLLSLLAERAVMSSEPMRDAFCEIVQPRYCGGILVRVFPWAADALM